MALDSSAQPLQDLISGPGFGFLYSPTLFQQRIQEEFLRSNRSGQPFLYLRIPTQLFDLVGNWKPLNAHMRAWKIAVLTLLAQTDHFDVKGYLQDRAGIGLVLLECDHTFLLELRKRILRNLKDAGLLGALRLKPRRPIFEVHYYNAEARKDHWTARDLMERFHLANEGFFDVQPLHFYSIPRGPWSGMLVNAGKRLLDLVGAGTGILLLSPLLGAVSLGVKLSDPGGSVIFKQIRVGLNGEHFTMFKFRSMYMDAEKRLEAIRHLNETTGPVFKMKNDPRIFPFGRFIRKFSIDELPQLFNILLGHMAIVGPRPPIPKEVEQYEAWHRMRLAVKPGLTCYWQVSGRSQIGFEDWMRLDNQYVRNAGLTDDITLIGKTFLTVIKGDGAY